MKTTDYINCKIIKYQEVIEFREEMLSKIIDLKFKSL